MITVMCITYTEVQVVCLYKAICFSLPIFKTLSDQDLESPDHWFGFFVFFVVFF